MPAGVLGLLAAAAWSFNRGKDLDQDPGFQARLQDPEFRKSLDADVTTLDVRPLEVGGRIAEDQR